MSLFMNKKCGSAKFEEVQSNRDSPSEFSCTQQQRKRTGVLPREKLVYSVRVPVTIKEVKCKSTLTL